MTKPQNTEGMQKFAELMLEAGCEAVLGMLPDGSAVLAVGDKVDPSSVSTVLRAYADAIDAVDPERDVIARVAVEVPDEG